MVERESLGRGRGVVGMRGRGVRENEVSNFEIKIRVKERRCL